MYIVVHFSCCAVCLSLVLIEFIFIILDLYCHIKLFIDKGIHEMKLYNDPSVHHLSEGPLRMSFA